MLCHGVVCVGGFHALQILRHGDSAGLPVWQADLPHLPGRKRGAAGCAEAAVQNVLSLSGSVPYRGSITILGDPTLVIGDSIDIVVLTSTGDVYDVISGQYYVTGVSDTIEGGKFTTTLSIVKKISAAGTTSIQSDIDNS